MAWEQAENAHTWASPQILGMRGQSSVISVHQAPGCTKPGHISYKALLSLPEALTFHWRPTPGLDTSKKNSLHLYSLGRLISKAYFHPRPQFTLRAATRKKRGRAQMFLLSKWETEAPSGTGPSWVWAERGFWAAGTQPPLSAVASQSSSL